MSNPLKKMNILIISTVRYRANGISAVIKNLYCNDIFKNENITFVFPSDSDASMMQDLKEYGYKIEIGERTTGSPVKYHGFLVRLMREGAYDLVHVHGNSSTCIADLHAAKKAGVPVRVVHGHNSSCGNVRLHMLLRPLLNRLCTARFACSKLAGIFLFGKKPFSVIPNAFNIKNYKFDPLLRKKYRAEYGLEEKTVIGHVGLLNKQKNQIFLVKMFREYQRLNGNSVLMLIGEGAKRQEIEDMVSDLELEDSVILTGSKNNVNEIINAFDYFVFPSVHEGLGIAPVEAQVNGLPVLCAGDNIPGDIEINPNFQFLSLTAGEEEWARILFSAPKERYPDGYNRVGDAGFDLERESGKLHEIYRDLILNS